MRKTKALMVVTRLKMREFNKSRFTKKHLLREKATVRLGVDFRVG